MISVPADASDPAAALDMAGPGDTIVLGPGTYRGGLTVPAGLRGLTIRGEDRNRVVFDGRDRGSNAITVAADGVTVENLTIHSFPGNGLLWNHVTGYAAFDVTVWNVGAYGIYAVGSRRGVVARSLVSGAGDAAFYVGECHPCEATLHDDTAMLSGLGYSGTNAGGSLVVEDSLFDRNGTGILPNSFDDEADPPQRDSSFTANRVVGSGSVPTPATDPIDGLTGIGIGVAGGRRNVVGGNLVTGSARYGIAVFATIQPEGGRWSPTGNRITANRVRGSGLADLALAAGAAAGNCFTGNSAATTAPEDLERTHHCGRPVPVGGDGTVSRALEVGTPTAFARSGPHPSYTDMPRPPLQPTSPPVRVVPSKSLPASFSERLEAVPAARRQSL